MTNVVQALNTIETMYMAQYFSSSLLIKMAQMSAMIREALNTIPSEGYGCPLTIFGFDSKALCTRHTLYSGSSEFLHEDISMSQWLMARESPFLFSLSARTEYCSLNTIEANSDSFNISTKALVFSSGMSGGKSSLVGILTSQLSRLIIAGRP
ncbi:hypothetical protein WICPIJ_001666 [Wickerhamomyces pijperi]|uniref:Uncharacterized protein n=1 Tax=Wickerhamomyces pijperi TaxID=599730 RepID=A0A9P8QD99_WICPI|nr:hypothetical protein WICPIJ_001666 [Wickerhamomyces pijperi]